MSKYGCHNSQRVDGYWGRDGSLPVSDMGLILEAQKLVWIEDRSSLECRYDKRSEDARCEGCLK